MKTKRQLTWRDMIKLASTALRQVVAEWIFKAFLPTSAAEVWAERY